jgi:hypothetical protein
MKRLAARAPDLEIFTSGYVLRHDSGWQITDAGREFLKLIEAPAPDPIVEPTTSPPIVQVPSAHPQNVIQLNGHRVRRRRRAA